MSSTLIYEQALYSDKFRNDLECGKYSDSQLIKMLENNELNDFQKQVLNELAPNVQQPAPQQAQPQQQAPATTPQTGYRPNTTPVQNAGAQQWKRIVQTLKSSQLLSQLKTLPTAVPNDKYVAQVCQYLIQSITELNAHLNPTSVRQANPQRPTL